MGFTLVELLISIAIVGIVTSIVLVKYGSFDSTVLLKSLAYEIALTLREAQVRSVSVSRSANSFDYPYGVTFSVATPQEKKRYISFRYKNATEHPVYDVGEASPVAEDIRTFPISRTMEVQDLCVTIGGTENCDIDRLDVSFRRPKFKGLFHAVEGPTEYTDTVTSAKIEVGSATGFLSFIVEVTSLGQISVYKKAP